MSDSVSIRKDNKDIFLPSIIIIFITAFVFAGFYLIKSVDNDLVCRITDVAGEETDPTMGRLIVCLTYFVSSLVLVTVADRRWKKDTDKLLLNWTLAVLGGTLLWTSVGECSWHFGLDVVSDEGTKMFASFPRIESIHGVPFFILGCLTFAVCFRKVSFPIASYMLAFLGNWYGHLCMIAAYPIAQAMGCRMDLAGFYKASALVNALVIAAAGVYLIAGKTRRTTKYMAAICMYVALGNVLFGIVMGET